MNENINLCKLLKGHERGTFYSPITGDVELITIKPGYEEYPIILERICRNEDEIYREEVCFTKEGKFYPEGECILFPSKDQKDWNKWAEEQKSKTPKTWSDMVRARKVQYTEVCTYFDPEYKKDQSETVNDTPIEKAALALLKIHQLIEAGYGGNITNEEWSNDNTDKYCIDCYLSDDYDFQIESYRSTFSYIAFHTCQQAEEFLSYEENIQLLKDFYMI